MFDRRTLNQVFVIVVLSVVAGTVSNATAGKGRKLKWIADWTGVPSATATEGASGPGGPGTASPVPLAGASVTPAASAADAGAGAGATLAPFEIAREDALAAHQSGALFLDARRSEDFAAGHIAGARSFAVWESDVDDKIVAMMNEVPYSTSIVCYCNGGKCEDSHTLRNKLLAAGYTDVRVYKDGLPDWREHGLPVEP